MVMRCRDLAASDRVQAVAVGVVDDAPVIVAGLGDGTVWVWDARSGERRGAPLSHGPDSEVKAVAVGTVNGRPVIVAGGRQGKPPHRRFPGRRPPFDWPNPERPWAIRGFVRLWDARTGEPCGAALPHGNDRGVEAVAIGVVDGVSVIVSGGGEYDVHGEESFTHGTVCLWDVRRQLRLVAREGFGPLLGPLHTAQHAEQAIRRMERIHSFDCWVEGVAAGMIDGQPIIASAGGHRLRLWESRSGTPWGERRHPGRVQAVAMGVVDEAPVVVSADNDGWIYCWDARTGQPRGEALRHGTGVESVAMGMVDGLPVIVSAGGCDVRLWDARTGEPLGEALRHDGWVESVVIGAVDEQPVIVATNRQGVRLW